MVASPAVISPPAGSENAVFGKNPINNRPTFVHKLLHLFKL
jgi:hypothetical protein